MSVILTGKTIHFVATVLITCTIADINVFTFLSVEMQKLCCHMPGVDVCHPHPEQDTYWSWQCKELTLATSDLCVMALACHLSDGVP